MCECFIVRSTDVYARYDGKVARFMPLEITVGVLVQSSSGSGRIDSREAGRSPRLQAYRINGLETGTHPTSRWIDKYYTGLNYSRAVT